MHQDASGRARERAFKMGAAVGSGYMYETTFKKETNSKYDVKISLTFDASYSTLHLKRVRKPYLTLATKDGQEIKINKKNTVKKKK